MNYDAELELLRAFVADYKERRQWHLLAAASRIYAAQSLPTIKESVLEAAALLAEIQNLEQGEENK